MAFDIACFPGKSENQWAYVLLHFQPRNVYVFSGGLWATPFNGAIEVATAEDIPGTLVLMAPPNGKNYQGSTTLADFTHPADCCYVFGYDQKDLSAAEMGARELAYSVYIPTDTTDQMFSWVAAAVTLHDRRAKDG